MRQEKEERAKRSVSNRREGRPSFQNVKRSKPYFTSPLLSFKAYGTTGLGPEPGILSSKR